MDQDDGALLLDLDSDPEVMRYINGGKPSTQEDLDQVLMPRINAFTNPDKGWGLWRVNRKDDNTFIGWILARPMFFFSDKTDYDDIELGWRFKRDVWGQGYATEAAQAVIKGLHQQRQYHKFSAIAVPENVGSIKIMKKLGMQFIKKELHIDPLYREVVEYYQKTM
jgi:RimJ/RimL family protein N-acetyltransferase